MAVRARPLNDREKSAASGECLTFQDVTGITLQREEKEQKFAFDCVMSQEIGQREVYVPCLTNKTIDLGGITKKVRPGTFWGWLVEQMAL